MKLIVLVPNMCLLIPKGLQWHQSGIYAMLEHRLPVRSGDGLLLPRDFWPCLLDYQQEQLSERLARALTRSCLLTMGRGTATPFTFLCCLQGESDLPSAFSAFHNVCIVERDRYCLVCCSFIFKDFELPLRKARTPRRHVVWNQEDGHICSDCVCLRILYRYSPGHPLLEMA